MLLINRLWSSDGLSRPCGLHYMTQGEGFCCCYIFISYFAKGDYYFFGPEGKNNFPLIYFKWRSSYGEIIMLIILESVLWKGGGKEGERNQHSEVGAHQRESRPSTGCHCDKHKPLPLPGAETQLSGEQEESTCHGNRSGPPSGTPTQACSRAQGDAELLLPGAAWAAS